MHAFVFRLVERLTSDAPALSRNRHFHTFQTPEGRQALRIARRLRSIAADIAAAKDAPRIAATPQAESDGVRLEIPLVDGKRTATLHPAEWELLLRMIPHGRRGTELLLP